MLANKDPKGLLTPFAGLADSLHSVVVPDHEHHAPADLARIANGLGIRAEPADGVADALRRIAADGAQSSQVLILGSLYLAGEVLAANGQIPN
jgi:dihydrofolate synthase/folylpolyglutamate synthase